MMNAKAEYTAFTGPKATPRAGNNGRNFCTAQVNNHGDFFLITPIYFLNIAKPYIVSPAATTKYCVPSSS
jgi:hypothetical protein